MKTFGHLLLIFFVFVSPAKAVGILPNLPSEGVLSPFSNHMIDPKVDYERFMGRVSDKDPRSRIFKIHVENNNTKFFRAGDKVLFKVSGKENKDWCLGFVRSVEDFYFALHVESLRPCFGRDKYFRRGTILKFFSKTLAQRVLEASQFREQLIVRKEDFLKELNEINHFLWSFDQQKVKVAADFDRRINELKRQRRRALDEMIGLKQEKLVLQNELMAKLNELDDSLKFYRVERQELITDRWHLDHDLGLPVGQRPQKIKQE